MSEWGLKRLKQGFNTSLGVSLLCTKVAANLQTNNNRQCWKARRYCLQVFVRGQRQIFPHLAGPAWIANQWSFFNQPPPWKWYLQWTLAISQASFSENCKFNVILEMTTDSVEQNDSFYMFWQNETFYMFCECWLVFEYSLKPGINIRNIWLTRPQLASRKLPEQNVAKF